MQGRSLSLKTFFVWVLISLYQGGVIMMLGFLLFEGQFVHVVAITFTSLIVNELLVVALTIRSWHGLMVLAELLSVIIYVLSLVVLKDYFGKEHKISLHYINTLCVCYFSTFCVLLCLQLYMYPGMQKN